MPRYDTGSTTGSARTGQAGPPIVALVCSAGGLEALISVLRPLPADLPAAIIVLQHQPPDKPSYLAEILARNCALPVSVARHGAALRAPVDEIPALLISLAWTSRRRTTAVKASGPVGSSGHG